MIRSKFELEGKDAGLFIKSCRKIRHASTLMHRKTPCHPSILDPLPSNPYDPSECLTRANRWFPSLTAASRRDYGSNL